MKLFSLTCFLFFSFSAYSRILDKIVAVVDNKIISQSEINRIKKTIGARMEIAPDLYKNSYKKSDIKIINFLVDSYIIQNEISKIGFEISDNYVEQNIKRFETSLNISRESLIELLKSRGLLFEEYFSIMRKISEIRTFNQSVIFPLVSVSEQEIKNKFFELNKNNKRLSYKYNLVGFSIPQDVLQTSEDKKEFIRSLRAYRITGSLPELYSEMSTLNLGELTEDGIDDSIKESLNNIQEGNFSRIVLINNRYHTFFVKKKDLVESKSYLDNKEKIRMQLISEKADSIKKTWLKNQRTKYFVKIYNK
jgi:peptidyl-prolyl cis-trans isomerase SurA